MIMSDIDFEGTNPRIGVSVGVTVPGDVKFVFIKPGVMMEMDVLDEDAVEETIDALTDYLMDKLVEIEKRIEDYVNE
jgi:hypothetical protein